MKTEKVYNVLKFLLFVCVTCFFILSPIYTSFFQKQAYNVTFEFPLVQIIYAVCMLAILIFTGFRGEVGDITSGRSWVAGGWTENGDSPASKVTTGYTAVNKPFLWIFTHFYIFLMTFALLFCLSLLIKYFSIVFSDKIAGLPFGKRHLETEVVKPVDVKDWIFATLSFFFSAFYEEALYRIYFPESLIEFFMRKRTKGAAASGSQGACEAAGKPESAASESLVDSPDPVASALVEVLACLAFALAHLYAGLFAGLNALFAHIILRVCYKKSRLIWPGFAAHFFYNVISLILL